MNFFKKIFDHEYKELESFKVKANENATLTITPKWGTGSGTNIIDPTLPIVYGTAQSEVQESSLTPDSGSGENSASSVEGENSAQGDTGPAAEENQADPREAGAREENGSPVA